jgi:nitrogen regulatory protein P-II 1
VKQVEALIRPSSLDAVVKALDRLDVDGVTISEVSAAESRRLRVGYRGGTYVVDAFPMVRVEVVSTDAYAGPIAWAIATAARTGHPGDGVVSIETVEDARRIRTGEQGIDAISARLDAPHVAQTSVALREADRAGMSDSTKVILTNVVLTPVFLVLFFHAPAGSVVLGAGIAGLLLWALDRRVRRTR